MNNDTKKTVLVVCVHNSARSQMAEEYIRLYGGDIFTVESAGINPGSLNPFVVKALQEEGIDISGKKTQSTAELLKAGRTFHYVLTVCAKDADEQCPVYPGQITKLHIPFDDPSSFKGSDEEKLKGTRIVRGQIKQRIKKLVEDFRTTGLFA